MMEYTIYLSDNKAIKVKGDSWEIDNHHLLTIYDLKRTIACFNMNTILGFEEHSVI